MDTPFGIDKCGDGLLVSLSGEIDLVWREQYANQLFETLQSNPSQHILVDMSEVTFADSCALALFAQMYSRSKDTDCKLYFASVSPIVMRAMETVGLTRYLNVSERPEQKVRTGRFPVSHLVR